MSEKSLKGGFYCYSNFRPKAFNKFDAVIFSGNIRNLSYWKMLFLPKWRKDRPKLLLWTHGWYGKESTLTKLVKKIYYKRADGILLYGDYAKSLMIREGFDPDKLFVIKNSLNYDRQLTIRKSLSRRDLYNKRFSNSNPVIIFIGRLTEEKRLDMIISALSLLKRAGKNFNLVLIGDGNIKDKLVNIAKNEKVEDNVLFWGECYDEEINAELIYNADLCVSPGNVGLTAIHAMMFGCPVISNDDFAHQGPEFESIIPNQTGRFFTKDSVESLASAIEQWFDGPGKDRETVRQACYTEIDTSWNPDYQMKVLRNALKGLE